MMRGQKSRKKRGNKMTDVLSKKQRLDGDEFLDVNEIKRENYLHIEDQSEVVAYQKRQLELSKFGME